MYLLCNVHCGENYLFIQITSNTVSKAVLLGRLGVEIVIHIELLVVIQVKILIKFI